MTPAPLDPLAAAYLEDLARSGARPRTIDTYATALRTITRLCGRAAGAGDFGARELAALAAAPAALRSRRLWLTALRSLHRWAREHGHPHSASAAAAELPAAPSARPMPLAADAIARVRSVAMSLAADRPALGAYFALLDGCGMRTGEPLLMSWSDVSAVLRPKRDRETRLQLTLPTSKVGARIVPLWDIVEHGRPAAALVVPALRRWHFHSGASVGPADGSAPLLDYGRTWAQQQWGEIARRAGVPDATPGQLRHTFACEELTRTGDIVRVGAWLGHASITTTIGYAQLLGMPTRPAI